MDDEGCRAFADAINKAIVSQKRPSRSVKMPLKYKDAASPVEEVYSEEQLRWKFSLAGVVKKSSFD